jgi:hypothetical protein
MDLHESYTHWLKLVTDVVKREIAKREAVIKQEAAQVHLDRLQARKAARPAWIYEQPQPLTWTEVPTLHSESDQ